MKNYSLNFWLLALSSFLFFGSFNLVLPELPDFMRTIGAEDLIGLHISVFTLSALLSRPFSGKLTDSVGRIPVMIFGTGVTAVLSAVYPFFSSIFVFFLIRFFHGFSTGFKPTGTTAYVADIVPDHKRGEALGIFSFFGMMGMGLGNYIGGEIAINYSIDFLFYVSAVVALLSVLVLIGLKETLPNPQKFSLSLLKINSKEIYEPKVLLPSFIMLLVTFSFGASLTLAPDLSKHLGIENKGLFFSFFTGASLVSRIVGGKLSDRFGRALIVKAAMLIVCIGTVMVGFADDILSFLIAGIIFGAGYGMSSPSLFAWATDLAPKENRGRAFSTVFMALEIGIGTGALLAGQLYAGKPENFIYAFGVSGILAFVAFIYLIFRRK